jgi:lipopolysaccharide export system protein LptA
MSYFSFVSACAQVWLFFTFAFVTIFAQGPATTRITDFSAPNTDASGRKSVVKGANAEPLGGGVFKITKPHVDNYRADGTLDTVIDASQCEFDSSHSHDVWSDKDLVMKSMDGRLSLKGIGFRLANSRLVISNNVEAVIRRQALITAATPGAPQTSPPANTNDFLRVTADSLDHSPELVIFKGHVHVVDAQGEVRCEILNVKLDEKNALQQIEALNDVILTQRETEARGKRALYSPNSGLLRLFENTRWRMGDREGESELLILDRTNNTLRAETKVKMTMPSSLLATNAGAGNTPRASTNKLVVTADTFDYAPTNTTTHYPIAIFNGEVHATDPQAGLDCELLTIFFGPTNRLTRAVADRNVVITRPDGYIKGIRAVFENDEITVPSNPTWKLKDNTGSAELLVFNPRTREIRALEKVHMEIPVAAQTNLLLSASAGKSAPRNPQTSVTNILVVTSRYFTNKDNIATFADHVRASEPRGQIDANKIELHLNSTNRVDRVIAEGDVILTEEKTQAIGQRADYSVLTGKISLTGTPKVMSENREIVAREFIVDRVKNQFQPIAPFHIEIKNIKAMANPLRK